MKRDVCDDKDVRDGRQGADGSVQPVRETSISLDIDERLDVRRILDGLENYCSPRRPWHWREGRGEPRKIGAFEYLETSESLKIPCLCRGAEALVTLTRSQIASSRRKSLPVDLRTISAVCAWLLGTAPITSW